MAAFDASTPREAASQERFLSELDRLADPFDTVRRPCPRDRVGDRERPAGHGTPLAQEARYLAATGRPPRYGRGSLGRGAPGGRGGDGAAGPPPARRAQLVHLDVHLAAESHVHLDLRYLLLCDDAEPAPAAAESQQVRWFTLDEALAIADEGLVDGLRRLPAALAR